MLRPTTISPAPKAQRLRFNDGTLELPDSAGAEPALPEPQSNYSAATPALISGPSIDLGATFSTATTAVNSGPGSPTLGVPIDYTRAIAIVVDTGTGQEHSYTCPEHLLFEKSGYIQNRRAMSADETITLRPQEMIGGNIKATTVERLLLWLYKSRFNEPDQKDCSFGVLLDLYFLALSYDIPSLKDHVLRQLYDKTSRYTLPPGRTKRIYQQTAEGDQLRRLWVNIYIRDVPTERFQVEGESGFDPKFLYDLALAQMRVLRECQKIGAATTPRQRFRFRIRRIRSQLAREERRVSFRKLFPRSTWDNPEIVYPDVLRSRRGNGR